MMSESTRLCPLPYPFSHLSHSDEMVILHRLHHSSCVQQNAFYAIACLIQIPRIIILQIDGSAAQAQAKHTLIVVA